jgi:histidyl-tRNA synthetase
MVLSIPPDEAERIRNSSAPDIFIVFLGEAARQKSFIIASELRRAGLSVALEFEDRKMKKAMAQANKVRAKYALIIGDDEVAKEEYSLKNLTTGEQESLDLNAVKAKLQ